MLCRGRASRGLGQGQGQGLPVETVRGQGQGRTGVGEKSVANLQLTINKKYEVKHLKQVLMKKNI